MSQQIPPPLPEQRSTADPAEAELPSHARLEEELHALRRPGLAGLRRLRPEALAQVSRVTGHTSDGTDEAAGIEALLEAAARRLAATPGPPGESVPPDGAADDRRGDPLGRAAAHTFGLFPGRMGRPGPGAPQGGRRRVRRHLRTVPQGPSRRSSPNSPASVIALARAATAAPARIEAPDELPDPPSRAAGPALPCGDPEPYHRALLLRRTAAGHRHPGVLGEHAHGDVEDLPPHRLGRSAPGRRDTRHRRRDHGRRPRPGTRRLDALPPPHRTARAARDRRPHLPGRPRRAGVRRIYHAAVALPDADGGGYHVAPQTLAEAVAAVFALANEERDRYDPPLASLCFPLLGSGRGGLPPVKAARWLRWAVQEELVGTRTGRCTS